MQAKDKLQGSILYGQTKDKLSGNQEGGEEGRKVGRKQGRKGERNFRREERRKEGGMNVSQPSSLPLIRHKQRFRDKVES